MKRLFLALIFLYAGNSFAIINITESFNSVSCPSPAVSYPANWFSFLTNSLGNVDSLKWLCTADHGKNNTGGVFCTGYYVGAFHVDTAYLVSPKFNLIGATDTVYLNFDTKTNFIYTGSKIEVLVTPDSATINQGSPFSLAIPTPVIGVGDSSDWVTHQINLYPYRFYQHLHVAFRYISNNSYGSIWYLDNVNTTTVKLLGVKNVTDEATSGLVVKGVAEANNIKLNYNAATAGNYEVQIMDMVGRVAYTSNVYMEHGNNDFALRDMNLNNGMYIVKISNGQQQAFAKAVVQ